MSHYRTVKNNDPEEVAVAVAVALAVAVGDAL